MVRIGSLVMRGRADVGIRDRHPSYLAAATASTGSGTTAQPRKGRRSCKGHSPAAMLLACANRALGILTRKKRSEETPHQLT